MISFSSCSQGESSVILPTTESAFPSTEPLPLVFDTESVIGITILYCENTDIAESKLIIGFDENAVLERLNTSTMKFIGEANESNSETGILSAINPFIEITLFMHNPDAIPNDYIKIIQLGEGRGVLYDTSLNSSTAVQDDDGGVFGSMTLYKIVDADEIVSWLIAFLNLPL